MLRIMFALGIIGIQALETFLFIWGLKIPFRWTLIIITIFIIANLPLPYVLWLQATAKQPPFWIAFLIVRPFLAWQFNWLTFLIFLAPLILLGRIGFILLNAQIIIKALRWFVFSLAGIWTLVSIIGLIGTINPPKVQKLEIPIPGLMKNEDGIKLVHLSDLHIAWWNSKEELERVADIVARLKPDLVLITGDIADHNANYVHNLAVAFENIKPPLGRYAITGNHDVYTAKDAIAKKMEQRGFKMLRNECINLSDKGAHIVLAGFEDSGLNWTGKDPAEKQIKTLISKCPEKLPTILLAHRPSAFEEVKGLPVPLTLTGHTHGGQLCLPFSRKGLANIGFKWTSGLYHNGPQALYVSRGIGTVGWPFRINCPAEITLLVLRAND